MTAVIAICGTMGSGKSTLAENAAAVLPDCSVIFEDDHNRMTEKSLEEVEVWFTQGGHVTEFDLADVIEQLKKACPDKWQLISAKLPLDSTASHDSNQLVASGYGSSCGSTGRRLVLLETHFGRLHSALRPWIDFQVWINTPADIAVARKVVQLSQQMTEQNPAVSNFDGLRWIEKFCSGYLTTTRKLFNLQRQQVGALSDVTIDGEGSPWDVCGRFLESLPARFRPEDC